jgi:hypothetical protein
MKLLTVQLPPFSSYFMPVRYKYSPNNPVLKLTQSVLFPECERPSFTSIQKVQNYGFAYFEYKRLNQMVASIS